MSRVERLHREKVTRYSIRKYSFGAASVAVAALFMFLGNGAVSANELSKQETSLAAPGLASEHEGPQEAESASVVAPASDAQSTSAAQPVVEEPAKPAAPEVTTPALDKKQLENYISEVKSKLSAGTYANKTEESLALLNGELASAESVLASATSQDELNVAYRNLVTTVSSKLKNKPKDSKDAPKVDTTNGQPTVGKKAENTEKKSESNAIENTGLNDPRNDKEIDKENAFRTEATATTHAPTTVTSGNLSYTIEFSNDKTKEVYAYNEEDTDIEISVNSTTGKKLKEVTVKKGSGQYLDGRPISSPIKPVETDGFGWSYSSITSPTTGPVTVRVTGKPNETFKTNPKVGYTKQENQNAVLGDRYLHIVDEDGDKISGGTNSSNPGYFKMVVKSQTYKYSIQQPENNANKIAVSNINNLTENDIQKIKDQIKIGYSTTSQDARLESKKGTTLDNRAEVVENIEVNGQNIVVTYKDGSVDTTPVADVARTDLDPVVEFPFSDEPKREIYVYGAEENSFDIKIKDDADKIKSATLLQWGSNPFKSVEGETDKVNTQYGYTANVISSETPATEAKPAVITYSGTPAPEGQFTQAKLEAATKGENPPGVALGWRYLKVVDSEGKEFVGSGKETANNMSLRVMLKPQTQKYDIQTPAEADKVAVDDASDVSEAEFNKIKEKLKIEYSKNNMDARLADKKGQAVENQADRITSIKKVDNNVVVTYKDGSTDTRPLTDFARTNNAPEVKIPYSTTANGKKDVYIYANEDIDIDIKYTDDLGKIKSATIKQGGNQSLSAKDAANPDVINNEYDMTFTQISAETPATAENPAIVKISGKVTKDTAGLKADRFPKGDNDEYRLVTRYATAVDTDGKEIHNVAKGSSYETDPGSFSIVLKSQTKKYDIRELADADKPVVTNIDNIPAEELAKLKENLPLEYSKKNEDKNLEDKKGKAVEAENAKKVVKDLVQDGENLVVTYQDGSKDTIPVEKVVKLDKQPAIEAVTNKATDQIAAIKGNDNLTQAEKDKAIAKVNEDKQAALEKIADATNATDVTAGKDEGTGAVAKVNPIGKEKAKEEIAKTLEAKKEAIENNDSLTQAEKEKAKKDAEDKAAAALAEIEKQPATAETADAATAAQTTVNDKQAEGTKEVAKINPIGKQAALDKIDEALKAKEAEMDARTDLTEEEKADAKAEAKKFADAKKAEINAKNDNAETPEAATREQGEIDTAGDTGKTEVEGVTKPAAKKPEAKTVVETTAAAKKQEIAQDAALTEEARAKLQAEVDAVKKASEEAIDGAKKNADVNNAKKSAEAAIKAINSARLPANKVIAENPSALNEDERKKLEDAIKAVNPPGTKVVVKDDGSAEVTLPGKQAPETLKQEDLTKSEADLEKDGGGNNINRPTDKVIVGNPESLTDADKENIKKAVREVNPNAVVTIDDNGTVTVSTPEGNTAGFPASELVRTLADAANPDSGNAGVRKPADKLVGDATNADLQAKATEKLKKLNGEDAKVKYDDEGNATVVLKDGTIATIPAGDLFKTEEDAKKANGGDDINKPNAQTVVEDIAALQGEANKEKLDKVKAEIKAKVEAVNPGAVVVVDDQGNAVVTTPAGKTAVIDADDLIKKPNETSTAKAGNNINNPADRVRVDNSKQLTDPELARIKAAVQAVNPDATVVVDAKGNATVVTPEGQTATIPVTDLVKSPEEAKDEKAGNNVNKPADKVAATKADLADDAKKADVKAKIKAAVEAVNPEGSKVFVDDQGNATVTTPDGKTATIPVEDLIKDTTQPNAGNKVNTPATKVVVTDPANIKADEDKIRAEILKVNPGATVAFDEKGNATVTTKDGAVATIPASDLAKDAADLRNPDKQDAVKKPADKTLVKKAGKLTPAEKDAIKAEIAKVNRDPKTTIVVDDEGNATVTTPDGKTVVIAKEDLVKSPQEVDGAKAGNNINKPADKVAAAAADLTGDKKDEVKAKIQKAVEAVNPGATVFVDDQGNATVTTPDGKTATIPVEDLLKDPAAKETPSAGNKVNTPAEKALVDPAVLNDPNATLPKDVKDAIQKAVESVNPGATVVVDDKGNATVTVTNPDGTKTTATIPASDLVKLNAKEDLENAAKQDAVKKPIDQTVVADKDVLTKADLDAIKAKVAEVNPDATVVVDAKGNATVTTKDGKTAVIAADDLVKTDDEVLSDPKAGNVINKPADRVFVKDGQITDDVKAKIAAKVQRINPGATVFVDENGNATVTTPEGKTATIPVADLTKTDADKAKVNAGNKINSPADRVLVKDRDKLTAEDIQEIEKNILEVNPGATVVFDAKGNATVKNANGDIATIPVEALAKPKADLLKPEKQDLIKKPVDKVLVTDPANVDKEAIKKAVEEVNPGSTVVVDDNGNATITTEDGRSFVIPAKDLVKTPEEAKNAKAGNNINKPADKVVVADPTKPLSPEEKKAIEAKIKEVNPDAKAIFVDDKGNATVTIEDKDGNTETATIPAADLVTSPEEAKQPNAGNKVNTPADKVVVSDPDHLSDQDKAKITEAIKAVNPEAKVAFDDKGNATVTTKDGEVATIPAADLVKTAEEAAKPNAGNNVNTPADKVAVDSTKPLTEDEKKAIASKVAEVNPGATVAVDDKGNATVTVNGKTAVIPAAALTKTADSAKEPNAGNDVVKPADKTVVEDPESLTKDEQDAIAAKVKAVNPEAKTVVVDDQGNATVTTKDGKTVVIPAKDLVKTAAEAAKPNAGNDVNTPADKTVVANPNALTPEEKKAIEEKVKAVNPGAEVVVDNKGNATVTTKDGKVAVIPASDLTKTADSAKEPNAGNDVVKPADKTVVANPDSLTKDEKDAIVAKVKAVNPDATVVVDDQGNATVTPKDGKPVVIPASDLTKTADSAKEPNAGNDIVKPADKTVVANPESLTKDEKDAIVAKVKAVNPGAEVVVDDQGNATVTKDGKTAVIPAADLTKSSDAEKAPKAGNDIVKPASKTKVANPDSLTKDEKDAIAAKVAAVNPGSTVVVDDQGNATVTLPNGNTAVIPASDLTKSEKDVNDGKAKDNAVTPASKTKVANPNALTEAEKKTIEDKVKAANPGATVVVDDKGNATVVKDGNVSVIPSTDLVKVEDDATKPNGGNDANTPAAKTVVADPTQLTDEEKAAVKKAVAAVNPGSTVVVDDKGNATVTKGDGTVLNIPASDLVIPAEKFADEAKTAKVKTPAIRTLVGNKENLTKDEKDAVKKSIEAVNPGATVVVDDKGNATVTMPDGSTATISKEQLVKDKEAVSKSKHGGDNLDIDLSKVEVADLANITPEEKAKFQFKVLGAITNVEEFDLDAYIKSTDKDGNTVYTSKDSKVKITIDKDGNATVEKDGKKELAINIDKAGNVTIVTKEGQVLAIPRDDAFKQRPYVPSNGGGNNGAANTDAKVDKAKLEGAIHQLDELFIQESAKLDAETAKEATDLLADAKKVFADPKANQDEVDAMVKRIEDFMAKVAPATDHATPAKDQAAQTSAPATTQAAANASQEAATNTRKAAKELPNTGTADSTVAMVAAAASALLGLGLAGRRRKEDEEA